MAQGLDVLLVEDSPQDAALLVRELKKGGLDPHWERVETKEALEQALRERRWSVVLSDYALPSFRAPDALALVQALAPEVPFIVVSGAIGEDTAVEIMRRGARDYVIKDKLQRLVPVVRRELDEAAARAARAEAVRRREGKDAFLAMAGAELTRVLAYPEILERVAALSVGAFADGCVLEVFDGIATRHAVAHRLPDQVARLEDALHAGSAETATAGRPSGTLTRVALRARGQDFGSMTLLRDSPAWTFDELDVDTARELGLRSAFAIENARLYQQAQDSIRARDEFLAIAAHELKTPLSPLRVQAQALVRALDKGLVLSPEKLRARLSAIDRATARLERLTDTLLEISEVTVGEMLLHREPVDLADVARTVVERLRVPLERAGSPVRLSTAPAVGSWDARRLEQACEHFLLNAAKYGAGHPIEVTVEADAATARLTVLDHGMGIAVAEQVHLFERFQRRAPLRHFGGFGLGLWVVRQVAEAHGGSVHLWSRPGLGARFSLELPRGPVVSRAREPEPTEEPAPHD